MNSNHFYPFFWQHGEDEDTLVHYVEKIAQSGMQAVCVESRPHPNFVGEKWWHDLNIIIRECEKRGMSIWILDDSHFPTGFANGQIVKKFPQYKKMYLAMRRFDVVGPFLKARIDASQLTGRVWEKGGNVDSILGVYLMQRQDDRQRDNDPIQVDTAIDITKQYDDGIISLDIPKGHWSVFVVFTTYDGGEESTKDYLNPLVKEATQVLVDEVYEKHKQQVGQHFGKTITAFFSDEPRFGNAKGCDVTIGTPNIVLPWRKGLEKELPFETALLPLLWTVGTHQEEREVRYLYMDKVTTLYNDNFVKVLADWCEQNGVEYVGHNIEDNGAHARLGYGAGHFFKGQHAQHFSGIDVIGGQVVPGMPYHHDAFQTGGSDGQFYHYALAKLGSSAAHLTPHKRGRAMCEAYGAYGWNEGLKTMKWITDHLMVRGINTIVPHAFDPKEYPDFDCPPHFYAHGHNPQYRYMTHLTGYANRVMSLLSNGTHRAPLAVFYPAELEWVGNSMCVESVTRVLTERQLDMDIVSLDHLKTATVNYGELCIANEQFRALIVPYAEYYPKAVCEQFNQLHQKGLRIIAVDKLPINESMLTFDLEVITLEQLAQKLGDLSDITLETPHKDLVYYCYEKKDEKYWFFFNESVSQTVDSRVFFKNKPSSLVAYDAYHDRYTKVSTNHLVLQPYETIMWIETKQKVAVTTDVNKTVKVSPVKNTWEISLALPKEYPTFKNVASITKIEPLSDLKGYKTTSGTVSYETVVNLKNTANIKGVTLQQAYEIAEVFVNGTSIGTKIAPPYDFINNQVWQSGDNCIRIEVTNTLGTQHRGGFNQYLLIEPFGLVGEVSLLIEE